jgi:hypothetical protein
MKIVCYQIITGWRTAMAVRAAEVRWKRLLFSSSCKVTVTRGVFKPRLYLEVAHLFLIAYEV